MVALLHLLLPLLASLPLVAGTRSELAVTKCAVRMREYSRIMDKTVKQATQAFCSLQLLLNSLGRQNREEFETHVEQEGQEIPV